MQPEQTMNLRSSTQQLDITVPSTKVEQSQTIHQGINEVQEACFETQIDKVSEENVRTDTLEVSGRSPKAAVRRAKQKLIIYYEEEEKRDSSLVLLSNEDVEIRGPVEIEDLLEQSEASLKVEPLDSFEHLRNKTISSKLKNNSKESISGQYLTNIESGYDGKGPRILAMSAIGNTQAE